MMSYSYKDFKRLVILSETLNIPLDNELKDVFTLINNIKVYINSNNIYYVYINGIDESILSFGRIDYKYSYEYLENHKLLILELICSIYGLDIIPSAIYKYYTQRKFSDYKYDLTLLKPIQNGL